MLLFQNDSSIKCNVTGNVIIDSISGMFYEQMSDQTDKQEKKLEKTTFCLYMYKFVCKNKHTKRQTYNQKKGNKNGHKTKNIKKDKHTMRQT